MKCFQKFIYGTRKAKRKLPHEQSVAKKQLQRHVYYGHHRDHRPDWNVRIFHLIELHRSLCHSCAIQFKVSLLMQISNLSDDERNVSDLRVISVLK